MPWSSGSVRLAAVEVIREINPATVLDIGPGAGTWYNWWPYGEWTGVEIWEPYVERFALKERYAHIIVGDAMVTDLGGPYDLGIMGDVLEHTTSPITLFERVRAVCRHVIAQVPLGYWPQGEEEGNPYEVHLSTIERVDIENWPGVVSVHENEGIGLVVANGQIPC